MSRRIISLVLSFGLLFQQTSFAQIATELNIAGYLSRAGSSFAVDKFRPLHLRYFSYDSLNDNFKILLDKGDLKNLKAPELENSTKTILSYFLIGVTLPDSMFWVNLRPDSEDQIIDQYLEKTDVGRIMLEADLQLKKDTAQMTSPQTPEGREYWDRLYKKASELYGYDNVTIPTLTRPWIVPSEIIVREAQDSAYIYKATLKVMLEQDYLKNSTTYNFQDTRAKALNEYSSQLIRELIIPKLTKEINSSKRYAPLRQVYYSLILSRWFKLRFTGKPGTYASLINTKNLTNLISKDSWSKTTYFQDYQKSFKDGEYNIQEPVYTPTGQVIRSYFSGGIDVASSAINTQNGIILSNDNANRLGEVIGGKAIIDPQSLNLHSIVTSSPISKGEKSVFSEAYIPGKIKRADLRNRFNDGGFVYNIATKMDLINTEMKWIADASGINTEEYKTSVENIFTDGKTPEQIQAELLDLRKKYNPGKYIREVGAAIDLAKAINQNGIGIFDGLKLNNERDIIIAMILADSLKQNTTKVEMQKWVEYMKSHLKIDDIELFTKAIRNTKEYIHVVGKNAGLAGDMELITYILKLWELNDATAMENKGKGHKIYIVAKSTRIAQDATVDDVKELLKETRYALIQQAVGKGIVEIIDSGSGIVGTDLTKATDKFTGLIEKANSGQAVLGFKGEENNFTVNGINAPHFRFFLAASRDSHIMTGVQWIEDSLIYDTEVPPVAYPIIINMPAGIEPAKDYFAIRQTRMEMKAFWEARNILTSKNPNIDWKSICDKLAEGPYRTLVEYVVDLYPEEAWHLLFEVYPGKIESGELSSKYQVYLKNKGIEEKDFSFFDFCKWLNTELKERIISGVVENGLGGKYDVQAYKVTQEVNSDIGKKSIARFEARRDGLQGKATDVDTQQLILRTVLVELDKYNTNGGLNLDIVAAGDVKPGTALFYPDKALNKGVIVEGRLPLISHTGGYFWPPALKTNGIDRNTPADYQRVSKLNGIIDMKVRDGKISMFPVYNKAVVIVYQDGRVQFARLSLDRGEITLAGQPIEWTKNDINPVILEKVAVFTPMNSKVGTQDDVVLPGQPRDAAYKLFGDNYKVGAGRFNIVLTGDSIAYIYYNSVYLQPEGIIVSLSEGEFRERFGEELTVKVKNENNTSKDTTKETLAYQIAITDIKMALPENINLQNIKYLYGGLTLVWNTQSRLPQNLLESIVNGSQLSMADYKLAVEKVEQEVRENFKVEGWYNDISRVTQETQLQQILIRGPRCYWVKTANYLMMVSAEGREDTAMGLNFPEAAYFAYQKLFDLLLKKNGDNKAEAVREFNIEARSLEILNFDGGSSVGLGSFIGLNQEGSLMQKHLAIMERCSGPANGKAGERPVPILVVHSVKGKNINDINITRITLRDIWKDWKTDRAISVSSPVSNIPEKTGGIDFRALPMIIQPMGSFNGLNFKLPQLSQVQLSQINIDSEIQQIKNMVQSGIAPSGQRIKELIAACMQKKELGPQVDSLLLCISDIFKLEEENASESSPELREALVIVDSQS